MVIDAGHGGKFPGAHYGNVYEKDLTLKVALKLGKLIEEGMPGVKVVYARKTDKALGTDLATDLQARADIANKAGGGLSSFRSTSMPRNPRRHGVSRRSSWAKAPRSSVTMRTPCSRTTAKT